MPQGNDAQDPLADILASLDDAHDPDGAPSATASLNREKARKMKADAHLAELKLAEKRGEMIQVREVAQVQFALLREVRNKLRAIPARHAAQLAQLDQHALRHRLVAIIDEALTIKASDILDEIEDD